MSWLLWGLGDICTRAQCGQRPCRDLSGRRATACQEKAKSGVGDPCIGAKYFALGGDAGRIARAAP